MKKILNALFLTLLTVFTFSSCSDVPAPYDMIYWEKVMFRD